MRTSSNPALTRIPAFAGANRTVGFGPRPDSADPIEQGYFGPTATARDTGRMTIEDVTVRTGIMLAIMVATGGLTWFLNLEALALPAAIIGMILGVVISLKQITNPAAILSYAAIEGVFLGGISKVFNDAYDGIVVQAVVQPTTTISDQQWSYPWSSSALVPLTVLVPTTSTTTTSSSPTTLTRRLVACTSVPVQSRRMVGTLTSTATALAVRSIPVSILARIAEARPSRG